MLGQLERRTILVLSRPLADGGKWLRPAALIRIDAAEVGR
jgi:hypothetical protein